MSRSPPCWRSAATVPAWLRRAVPEGRLRTVEVGGLSVGAIQELLRARLDATFPRPTLIRLWETSRGNPFFALELARALQRRGGTLAPGEELPIPSDLDELLHARLDGLSAAALEVARAVAALADPTVPLVEAAVGRRADAGLAETLAARILELDGERLRFTHPLLGSAVAARQTPARRRSLHARLANLVPTAEERARHLALATRRAESRDRRAPRGRRAVGARARRAGDGRRAGGAGAQADARRDVEDARRRLLIAADMHHAARATPAVQSPCSSRRAPRLRRASSGQPCLPSWPASRQARTTPSRSTARHSRKLKATTALQATIHLRLAGLMRLSEGDRARHRARGARRSRRLACRRRRAALPRARGLRPACTSTPDAASQRVRDGRGALARAIAGRVAARRRSDVRSSAWQLCWSADVDRARELFQEVLQCRNGAQRPRAERQRRCGT